MSSGAELWHRSIVVSLQGSPVESREIKTDMDDDSGNAEQRRGLRRRHRDDEDDRLVELESRPARRLTRSKSTRMLGGVCGGLAHFLGVDPTLVRIVFLLGIFVNGASLLAYLAALMLVPLESSSEEEAWNQEPSRPIRITDDRQRSLVWGIALMALGGLLMLSRPPFSNWFNLGVLNWGLVWPMAMIVFGVWILMRQQRSREAAPLADEGFETSLDEAQEEIQQVVEGVLAAKAVKQVADRLSVEMPICQQIYRILYEDVPPREAVGALMGRSLKRE